MKSKTTRNILIVLLAFLGLGAIFGSGALILSPSGKLLGGLPLAMIAKTPFTDFLIPGIILFLVIGVTPLLLIQPLLKKTNSNFLEKFNFFGDIHWAWSFSVYIAFSLIIWIQTEMLMISAVH